MPAPYIIGQGTGIVAGPPSSSTTVNVVVPVGVGPIPVGTLVIIMSGMNNSATSIDSRGNVYGGMNVVGIRYLYAVLTTQLEVGDTIPFTASTGGDSRITFDVLVVGVPTTSAAADQDPPLTLESTPPFNLVSGRDSNNNAFAGNPPLCNGSQYAPGSSWGHVTGPGVTINALDGVTRVHTANERPRITFLGLGRAKGNAGLSFNNNPLPADFVLTPGEWTSLTTFAHTIANLAGTQSYTWTHAIYYKIISPGTPAPDYDALNKFTVPGVDYKTAGGISWGAGTSWRTWVVQFIPEGVNLDLLQLKGVSFLFRSYQGEFDNLGSAIVERSLDAGASWPKSWTVASGLETTGTPSIPTLASSPWDDVFVVVHDASGFTRIYLYNPITDSWSLHASSSSSARRYPRMVVQAHRQVICGHDGTDLLFFASQDYFVTAPTALTGLTIAGIPAQLCVLREDRRGALHVVYVTGAGALLHRYSEDGITWSATNTLDTGVTGYVGYGLNLVSALLLYWKTTTLHALRLEEDYRSVDTSLTAPAGSWIRGTMPVVGTNRDDFMALGKIGADLETRYSPDLGVSFAEPS
jgi:hypothetical protein